jgi:hypothetical protein
MELILVLPRSAEIVLVHSGWRMVMMYDYMAAGTLITDEDEQEGERAKGRGRGRQGIAGPLLFFL